MTLNSNSEKKTVFNCVSAGSIYDKYLSVSQFILIYINFLIHFVLRIAAIKFGLLINDTCKKVIDDLMNKIKNIR